MGGVPLVAAASAAFFPPAHVSEEAAAVLRGTRSQTVAGYERALRGPRMITSATHIPAAGDGTFLSMDMISAARLRATASPELYPRDTVQPDDSVGRRASETCSKAEVGLNTKANNKLGIFR